MFKRPKVIMNEPNEPIEPIDIRIDDLICKILRNYGNHGTRLNNYPICTFDVNTHTYTIIYKYLKDIPLTASDYHIEQRYFKKNLLITLNAAYNCLGTNVNKIRIGKQTKHGFDCKICIE